MTSTPTLKKISEHLSISISTVSRALKDHPDVSSDTIKRVKELATLLEYEPNGFAVNLRKRSSNVYAILVPEISGYFYHSFIQAIEEEARKRSFGLMIMQTMNNPFIESENLKICRYNHVAGVFAAITATTTEFSSFQKTEEAGVPVVFFDKVPDSDLFTTIQIADYEGGALAADMLNRFARTRILCIMGNPSLSITRERKAGFIDFWKNTGRQEPEFLFTDSEETAYQAIYNKCSGSCTDLAIFCMSDEILCGVMRALYQMEIRIPDDVAIIAMSNGFMPRYFNPQISFIETSGLQLGNLSFEAMEKKRNSDTRIILNEKLQCTFFEGGSLPKL